MSTFLLLGRLLVLVLAPATVLAATPAGAQEAAPAGTDDAPPTEAMLGVPIYPEATFLTSYDAGRGQRYYLFGTDTGFDEMVRYYAVVLDERGDRVFNLPATHFFETGRFRDDRMAFAPSVTIKDHSWNGSDGLLDPSPGGRTRYRTVIQIVPPPGE